MGQDLNIRTKGKIKFGNEPEEKDVFFLVDRGFCSFYLNAKNKSTEIIDSLGKALGISLYFLLEPEYNDPNWLIDFLGEDTDNTKRSDAEPTGWVELDPFLEKLIQIESKIRENPYYEKKVIYDRKWWLNYFGDDFQTDIRKFIEFFNEAKRQEVKEFSFETM